MKKWLIALVCFFSLQMAALAAVNINTASMEQLQGLSGVGPAKAKAIVDFRTKGGPFKCIEDIKKVPGIKEDLFNKIKSDIVVDSKPAAPAPAKPAKPAKK